MPARPDDVLEFARGLMNCGPSSCSAKTSAGCGWPSAAEPARSSLTSSAAEAKRPAASCGSAFPPATRPACSTPTFGPLTPKSCPQPSTGYAEVLPAAQHRATGKGAGQTCHIERFNNILRQRLARFVRRTLSFSKTDAMHENCLRLFLHEYNRQKSGKNQDNRADINLKDADSFEPMPSLFSRSRIRNHVFFFCRASYSPMMGRRRSIFPLAECLLYRNRLIDCRRVKTSAPVPDEAAKQL